MITWAIVEEFWNSAGTNGKKILVLTIKLSSRVFFLIGYTALTLDDVKEHQFVFLGMGLFAQGPPNIISWECNGN